MKTTETIPHCLQLKSSLTYLVSSWLLQAGEENPVVHLSVVSLNGPLHTVVMKKPDDPRIGWVTYCVWSNKQPEIALESFLNVSGGDVFSFCGFPGGNITSPWWNGPPAPNWLSTGWTEARTTPSWHCVRRQLESALRWNIQQIVPDTVWNLLSVCILCWGINVEMFFWLSTNPTKRPKTSNQCKPTNKYCLCG